MMQRQFFLCKAMLLCLAILISLNGCGGGDTDNTPKGSVSGTVKVDGKPYEQGAVRLVSTEHGSYTFGAEMKSGGAFSIGAPIPTGSYKVTLSPPSLGPITEPDGTIRPATEEDVKVKPPAKFMSPETSDETVEVKEGDNSFTIDLKS